LTAQRPQVILEWHWRLLAVNFLAVAETAIPAFN
jgi:hypothetical protein